ncbi:MAG: NADH-quinone oxidoreductase subunit NuoH [Chloroflexi bacterium]|nr:NADH-quinone oxidoreductase subunit NuoH [Chloroflexota bacterium]
MSDFVIFLIDALVKSLIIVVSLLTGFAYTTVLERRVIARIQVRIGPNRAGPFGLLQPVSEGLKLFFKEDIVPNEADKVIFTLAPVITAVPALIVLAVVPLGSEVTIPFLNYTTSLGLSDINVGVLYILAVTSISVYGITLAGWASANKYAMLGGLRSAAQMISYELALGVSLLVPVSLAGSLSLGAIINAQDPVWFVFYPIVGQVAAAIFYIAILAETNRAPFDLPEAEQELTAGYHTEYSGMKFAAFFMAEYMKMIAVSAIFASLFLGGYRLFGLEDLLGGWMGPLILAGKVVASLVFMIWLRATLPRFRYDRLMSFGWKVLLPVSLVTLVLTWVVIVLELIPVAL